MIISEATNILNEIMQSFGISYDDYIRLWDAIDNLEQELFNVKEVLHRVVSKDSELRFNLSKQGQSVESYIEGLLGGKNV